MFLSIWILFMLCFLAKMYQEAVKIAKKEDNYGK